MGNQMGILTCGGTMLISRQYDIPLPSYAYPLIYLIASLLSQFFGGSGGPEVGKKAPQLATDDLKYLQQKGEIASPGTLGKVVVVERWATWCGPCVHMIPHLNKIYEQYKDRSDFQLVGVTDETDVGKVQAFMKKHNMQYSVAIDVKSKVSSGYPSAGIPNATIVGKDGNVFWNGHPGGMDTKLAEALSQTSPTHSTKRPSGDSTSKASAATSKDSTRTTKED
jgi:thiol-disulfide isomerase/thioredoxin